MNQTSTLFSFGIVGTLILLAWYVLIVVQAFLGYGTAYRKAKTNGDSGLSLFGWLIVYCSLTSLVSYLGIHLWKKIKTLTKNRRFFLL